MLFDAHDPGLVLLLDRRCKTIACKRCYASLMVFVYPVGITLFFAALLYKNWHYLGPKDAAGNLRGWRYMFVFDAEWTMASDQEKATRVYEEEGGTAHLAFLTGAYQPRAFWWVIFDNARRLLLNSALVIFAVGSEVAGSAQQAIAALLICVASIKVYQYYSPFVDPTDDQFSELAQCKCSRAEVYKKDP